MICMVDFSSVYRGAPPWDIGRPQKEFVRLEGAGEIVGSVLDVVGYVHLPGDRNERAVVERCPAGRKKTHEILFARTGETMSQFGLHG